MPATTPSLDDEVTFVTGVDSDGVVATNTYATLIYNHTDIQLAMGAVPDYNLDWSTATKFGSNTAGTASGTISYAFNAASNYTPVEQAIYISSMALWSAVANISFVATDDYAEAKLQFIRGSDGKAYQDFVGGSQYTEVGDTALAENGTAFISVDTKSNGFGPLVSINTANGYPATTVVHEIGHALGLGHGGGYNGKVYPETQQFSPYDTRLYTIMSYISPDDARAEYYANYDVTGTDWGNYEAPETPMSLDILAVQRLYGLPVTTPLSGGQVFGYHSNITGALANYFDFTLNSKPVLTLWDAGGDNTLDLSGYGAEADVNLNPGTYSSADGLVNNIGIAFNTAIDTVIGGSGNDNFIVNADCDTIDGGGGSNTVTFPGALADYGLVRSGDTVTVTDATGKAVDTLLNIETLIFADAAVATDSIACFAHGTLIATPVGEVAVETLSIGDLVTTAAGKQRPIRWLGRRSYIGRFFSANVKVRPIRFVAGSLGNGLPRRDLRVSPEHAMFLSGMLIPALALVNGCSIAVDHSCKRIDYVHIELDSHDIIFAEGAATETFLDDDSRMMFSNAAEYLPLYGQASTSNRFYAPRVTHGFALQAILGALPSANMIKVTAAQFDESLLSLVL